MRAIAERKPYKKPVHVAAYVAVHVPVRARSCAVRASIETITTGRSFFSCA